MADPALQWRKLILEWIEAEWESYADGKFGGTREREIGEMAKDGFSPEGFWFNQVFQYVTRAQALTLDNPNGRQAAMKTLTTLIDCIGCMITVYGLPPAPGYSSGDLHEWEPETEL